MTITLIGMPGAGKTVMGKALAAALEIEWIDADRCIEARAGRRLQDIINEDGLAAFCKLEEEVLISLTEKNAVISTGGSAIYYDRAMKALGASGKIVYLAVGLGEIVRRIGDYSKRGIVLEEGKTIADLYNERVPLYEKYADITLDCDGVDYPTYQKALYEAVKDALR